MLAVALAAMNGGNMWRSFPFCSKFRKYSIHRNTASVSYRVLKKMAGAEEFQRSGQQLGRV